MIRRGAIAIVLLGLLAIPLTAQAEILLEDVSWETIDPTVRFHLTFYNPDVVPSEVATCQLSSQEFGAFLPNFGLIEEFDIPPIPPDSFFDVFFDVPLDQLPPSAEELLPEGGGPQGPAGAPQSTPCPPDNFWNGNVDVFWFGPGGTGQVQAHFGTVLVCPGAGNSYIHVILDCQDPAGVSWNVSGVCTGWAASLYVDAGGTPGGLAPNPIPPGFFDGWIGISATQNVAIGTVCNLSLNLMCGNAPATVNVTVEACDWGPVPTEPMTWGSIKLLYQ
jgi:hypothetical protein